MKKTMKRQAGPGDDRASRRLTNKIPGRRRGLARLALLSCLLLAASAWAQSGPPEVRGAWLGQIPPGETPLPFAPELFASLSPWVEAVDFSPDGRLCLISVGSSNYANARLLVSRARDGQWSPFEAPSFTAGFAYANEPVFLADGRTVQFTGMKSPGSKDFWTVSYTEEGWGEPRALPSPVNSQADEYRASYAKDGSIYFASERSGMNQIYKGSRDETGGYVVSLVGPPISKGSIEADPCIAPDGSYLVFMSCRDNRSSNNYVSFSDGQGGWGQAMGLGEGFNSSNDEYGAHLSADGSYLFFTRHGKAGNAVFWVAESAIAKRRR